MRWIQLLVLAGMLGGLGCGKEPGLKMPPTAAGDPVDTNPKGPSPEEQAARAAIEKLGGRFDKEVAFGMPGLLIDLTGAKIGDAELKGLIIHLQAFPTIGELDLSESTITTAGLKELRVLKNLRSLAVPEKLLDNPVLREINESNEGNFSVRGPYKPVGKQPK